MSELRVHDCSVQQVMLDKHNKAVSYLNAISKFFLVLKGMRGALVERPLFSLNYILKQYKFDLELFEGVKILSRYLQKSRILYSTREKFKK